MVGLPVFFSLIFFNVTKRYIACPLIFCNGFIPMLDRYHLVFPNGWAAFHLILILLRISKLFVDKVAKGMSNSNSKNYGILYALNKHSREASWVDLQWREINWIFLNKNNRYVCSSFDPFLEIIFEICYHRLPFVGP